MRKSSDQHAIGFAQLIVQVTEMNPPWAVVKDSYGKNRNIRADFRRGAGRLPRVDETWLLDRTLGEWTFAALYSSDDLQGDISFDPWRSTLGPDLDDYWEMSGYNGEALQFKQWDDSAQTLIDRFSIFNDTEQSVLETPLKIVNPVAAGGTDDGQLRLTKTGDPNSALFRNDGNNFYILGTDTEDGTWNAYRPFIFNLATGAVDIGGVEGVTLGRIDAHLDPITDLTYDLGDASLTWRRIYVNDIYDSAGVRVIDVDAQVLDNGTWEVDGSLNPQDDLVHYLGSSTRTWLRLYVEDIYDRAGTLVINIDAQVLDNGTWQVDGALHPQDNNAHDLGSTALTWQDLYVYNIRDENGNLRIDTSLLRFTGHVDPAANNTYDLGDGTLTWRYLYAYNIRDEAGTTRIDLSAWIRMADGSASAPSYTFANQTNTGMWFTNSNNRLWLNNAGNELMLVAAADVVPGDTAKTIGLGNSTFIWQDVWANDTTINNSDPRLKDDLGVLVGYQDVGAIVDAIHPTQFKWKSLDADGLPNARLTDPEVKAKKRWHWGWNAVQIAEALGGLGLDPGDYGVYIDPTKEWTPEYLEVWPEAETHGTSLALRAGELVPVLWAEVQSLRKRVGVLEAA